MMFRDGCQERRAALSSTSKRSRCGTSETACSPKQSGCRGKYSEIGAGEVLRNLHLMFKHKDLSSIYRSIGETGRHGVTHVISVLHRQRQGGSQDLLATQPYPNGEFQTK